jgi:hypothetical protein
MNAWLNSGANQTAGRTDCVCTTTLWRNGRAALLKMMLELLAPRVAERMIAMPYGAKPSFGAINAANDGTRLDR